MHNSIISFLGHAMYSKYFHEEEQIDDAWASPRQWTRLSNFLCSYEEYQNKLMPVNQLLYYATGHVGKVASSQYMKYYEMFSKFNMTSEFENSENFIPPTDELNRYIFVFACLNHIVNKYNKKTSDVMNGQIVNIAGALLNVDESLGILLLKEILMIDAKSTKVRIRANEILTKLEETHNGLLKKILDERKEVDDD
jgi:hypothetical protein